jgi:hypothetical protein
VFYFENLVNIAQYCSILLTAMMALNSIIPLMILDTEKFQEFAVYFLCLKAFWYLMFLGAMFEHFPFCVCLTALLSIVTLFVTGFKLFIIIIILAHPLFERTTVLFMFVIYLVFWYITAYVFFSYTKSLDLDYYMFKRIKATLNVWALFKLMIQTVKFLLILA